uniref:Uncharacterized protein n=1 Tax=Arion vulgaris TaxID=1028688 RepID=A0A0B6YRX8_9EUPU
MTFQSPEPVVQHSTSKGMTFSSQPVSSVSKVQYSMYKTTKPPSGFFKVCISKIEMVFIYAWVLVQTLFLIAGLTVLHFSTFSVMVVYLVNGVIKGRRELLPQK